MGGQGRGSDCVPRKAAILRVDFTLGCFPHSAGRWLWQIVKCQCCRNNTRRSLRRPSSCRCVRSCLACRCKPIYKVSLDRWMRLALLMLGREGGRCREGGVSVCVCGEINILLLAVLQWFKYYRVSWCSSYGIWLLPMASCLLGFILQPRTGRYPYPNQLTGLRERVWLSLCVELYLSSPRAECCDWDGGWKLGLLNHWPVCSSSRGFSSDQLRRPWENTLI